MLSFIPPRPDYDKWLRIASAVWSVLPAGEGATLLNRWSREEADGEYMAKHKSRLKRITIGSLVYYAKEEGWRFRRGKFHSFANSSTPSQALKRSERNSRPKWLPRDKPKSAVTAVATVQKGEQSPTSLGPHSAPSGRCCVCWERWGRFLRENHCICTGDVQR